MKSPILMGLLLATITLSGCAAAKLEKPRPCAIRSSAQIERRFE